MRLWVAAWRQAGLELDEVRRREIECADTQEAVGNCSKPAEIPSTSRLRPRPPVWSISRHGLQRCGRLTRVDDASIGGGTRSSGFSHRAPMEVLHHWGHRTTALGRAPFYSRRGRDLGKWIRTGRRVHRSAPAIGLSGTRDGRRGVCAPEPCPAAQRSWRHARRLALGGLPFEEEMVERSSLFEFTRGCRLRTCSAEDLIILKLFAFRPRDVPDVETEVVRQRGALDWDHIERHLGALSELKEQPEIMATFARLRGRYPPA